MSPSLLAPYFDLGLVVQRIRASHYHQYNRTLGDQRGREILNPILLLLQQRHRVLLSL